jgi:hypothetical protein
MIEFFRRSLSSAQRNSLKVELRRSRDSAKRRKEAGRHGVTPSKLRWIRKELLAMETPKCSIPRWSTRAFFIERRSRWPRAPRRAPEPSGPMPCPSWSPTSSSLKQAARGVFNNKASVLAPSSLRAFRARIKERHSSEVPNKSDKTNFSPAQLMPFPERSNRASLALDNGRANLKEHGCARMARRVRVLGARSA